MKAYRICLVILLMFVPNTFASSDSRTALVFVPEPSRALTEHLLDSGVMVVRNMGDYLLAVAPPEPLTELGNIPWELLDSSIDGVTYYTVAYRDPHVFLAMNPPGRTLKITDRSAVIAATPSEAEVVSAAGFEIAAVFMRPIRLPAVKELPPARSSGVPSSVIQDMVDAVSSASVDGYVQRLQDFVTRHSSHDSCAAAAGYIKQQFESFGITDVTLQPFRGGYHENVVAVMPGVGNPSRQIIIGGHFDSITYNFDIAPGADDNASGTSCVLECARVLSGHQFEFTIIFIAFCGEEQGLLGSEAYAADAVARGDDILAMINVDMIGYVSPMDDLDLDVVGNAESQWLLDRALTVAGEYVPELDVIDGGALVGGTSDHASFWDHGFYAVLLHEDVRSRSPLIHTSNDIVGLSYNSSVLAERSVRVAVALVADLAVPFIATAVPDLAYTLEQNYPNPFNGGTTIEYSLEQTTPVSLKVYDTAGRWVRTLVDEVQTPEDRRTVRWDGRNADGRVVASGLYFYRIVTTEFAQTRKMLFLK